MEKGRKEKRIQFKKNHTTPRHFEVQREHLCTETWQLRHQVMQGLHDSTVGGHSGVMAAYHRINKLVYWPKLKVEVHQYIIRCQNC